MEKRNFIKLSILGLGSVLALPVFGKGKTQGLFNSPRKIDFSLPKLPYSYDALEPFIDAETMRLHHLEHHAGYADNFKKAVKEFGITGKSGREIISETSKYSDDIRNYGGGYVNHNIFWRTLSPNGGGSPKGKLLESLENEFGSFENFKKEFSDKVVASSGSGWVWLIYTPEKRLKTTVTENQDNPVMDIAEIKGRPLLLIDVWEHAYYLKYKNNKKDYVENYWKVVNWDIVEKKFEFFTSK